MDGRLKAIFSKLETSRNMKKWYWYRVKIFKKYIIFQSYKVYGSKIGSATPIWISKFKRAWQTQFLSYNLETLEKWVFFKDVQMILVSFFHISTSFQLRKNAFKSSVHILRRPWVTTTTNALPDKILLQKCKS